MGIRDTITGLFFHKSPVVQTSWSAGVYYNADRIVIHTSSRTVNNIGWYNQPVWSCASSDSAERIGEILNDALSASTWFSEEDDSDVKPPPTLKAAGVRSWRALEKQFDHISVVSDQQQIEFRAMRKSKKRGEGQGWIILRDDELPVEAIPADASSLAVGEGLLQTMDRFREWEAAQPT